MVHSIECSQEKKLDSIMDDPDEQRECSWKESAESSDATDDGERNSLYIGPQPPPQPRFTHRRGPILTIAENEVSSARRFYAGGHV